MTAKRREPGAHLFPRLSQFASGYLHQDFVVEHKTPRGALRAFLADASPDERAELLADVERFLAASVLRPWSEVRAAFLALGGAWAPRSRAELVELARRARVHTGSIGR